MGEGANFGEKGATTWLAKRPVRHPDSKGKSLYKVDGLIEIPRRLMRILRLGL